MSRFSLLQLWCSLLFATMCRTAASAPMAPVPPPAPRVAVLVGANEAIPGRRPLYFAHADAERMAAVLTTVGRFASANVVVLRDPTPAALLDAVRTRIARIAGQPESMFYFYYSGHADERSIYPGGQPLPLDHLREALDGAPVDVKVGMVDACRGGGWTRAKGVTAEPPFAVKLPFGVGSEGSVLISSSSGLESAHESDLLQGSFFTTHFIAGLRGAADKSGNGEITLTEAFEYARELTIRDSLRHALEIQHPSYAVNLRGRNDVVLAHLAASPSTVIVEQQQGPLELIHADTGVQLLELPTGKRRLRLAVPPGRYLVRKTGGEGHSIKELAVQAGSHSRFDEAELTLVGTSRLAVKGVTRPDLALAVRASTVPRRRITHELALGPTLSVEESATMYAAVAGGQLRSPGQYGFGWGPDPTARLVLRWGITDRLTWRIGTLGFAYRLGDPDRFEFIPVAGIIGWNLGELPASARVALGGSLRRWQRSGRGVFTVQAHAESHQALELRAVYGSREDANGSLGYSLFLGDRVTLNFAVGGHAHLRGYTPYGRDYRLLFGSVQVVGLRPLPLVEAHIDERWSLQLFVSAEFRARHVADWGDGIHVEAGVRREKWLFPTAIGVNYIW